jgi:serine/threonine-protein kinase ULK/ATG1
LYEMAVGKPPFRAANHIELLKKIEHSKGIKFPDEDPKSQSARSGGGGSEDLPVPPDVKKLIRALLKQNPAERASFEEFFGSTALAKSKFPRPVEPSLYPSPAQSSSDVTGGAAGEGGNDGAPVIPPHHLVIPPEVLDPNAMIPPSKFNFREPRQGQDNGSVTRIPVAMGTPPSPRYLSIRPRSFPPSSSTLCWMSTNIQFSALPPHGKNSHRPPRKSGALRIRRRLHQSIPRPCACRGRYRRRARLSRARRRRTGFCAASTC